MTESNDRPAPDLKGAQDRIIAELRALAAQPTWMPPKGSIKPSTHSRGPRSVSHRAIR
jgi:hypothetical protein